MYSCHICKTIRHKDGHCLSPGVQIKRVSTPQNSYKSYPLFIIEYENCRIKPNTSTFLSDVQPYDSNLKRRTFCSLKYFEHFGVSFIIFAISNKLFKKLCDSKVRLFLDRSCAVFSWLKFIFNFQYKYH